MSWVWLNYKVALHNYYICILYSYLKGKAILKKLCIFILAFLFSILSENKDCVKKQKYLLEKVCIFLF